MKGYAGGFWGDLLIESLRVEFLPYYRLRGAIITG
jgi:hypothetical protein